MPSRRPCDQAAGRTGGVERIEARRAPARRLALRHRLAPESRAASRSTPRGRSSPFTRPDPMTVFLSTWARTSDFEAANLEQALYDERTLVRMLGMRRTLWVVPRDLVDGRRRSVHADDRRAGAETSRGIRRRRAASRTIPAAGSTRPPQWRFEALEARGEAFTTDLTRADPLLATKLRLGRGDSLGGRA